MKELNREAEWIVAELKKAIGPGGRRRKLGSTAARRAWEALRKNVGRLPGRLSKRKMPRLAEHLQKGIIFICPTVAYHPPDAVPWQVLIA